VPDAVPPSQAASLHPPEWLGEFTLPDGAVVRFRHVRAEDESLIGAAINSASRETLLHRFFSPIRRVGTDQLRRMLVFDPKRETCVVGVSVANGSTRIVCGARYVKLDSPDTAEIAITVHDDFQHRGLGAFSLRLLARLALEDRVARFEAEILSSNLKMLNLVRKLTRGQASGHWTGDVYHVEMPVSALAVGEV
jgi:acetyltransferase